MTQTKQTQTRIALPFSMDAIENTSGQGYSVRVRHLTRAGNEITRCTYSFDWRVDAMGYIADLHTMLKSVGYIQLQSQHAHRFIYKAGAGMDGAADMISVKERIAYRILIEIGEIADETVIDYAAMNARWAEITSAAAAGDEAAQRIVNTVPAIAPGLLGSTTYQRFVSAVTGWIAAHPVKGE